MKKTLLIAGIVILSLMSISVEVSSTPAIELKSGVNYDLYDITFYPLYAVSVGTHGTIVKYENNTSIRIPVNVTTNLYSVDWAPYGDFALICGENGTLLKYCLNDSVIMIPLNISLNLYKIRWNWAHNYALIVGENGTILKYQNNNISLINSGTNKTLCGLGWKYGDEWAPETTYALIVGENGTILKYIAPSPTTYTIENLEGGVSTTLYGVSFALYMDYALIVGESGTILRYDENSIVKFVSGFSCNFYDVAFMRHDGNAIIAGDNCIYYDGIDFTFITFQKMFAGNWDLQDRYALFVGEKENILEYKPPAIEKDEKILSLLDIGVINSANNLSLPYDHFRNLCWQENKAIIVGTKEKNLLEYDGITFKNLFLKTKNLRSICYDPSTNSTLIVGIDGVILRYEGEEFLQINITEKHLMDIAGGKDYALIVGANGTILKYCNGSFDTIPTTINKYLQCVSFSPDGSIALIVGEEGMVLKYDGYKITELPLKTNYMLSSCSWRNDNEAIIVGARGTILKYYQDNLSLIPNTISNNLYGTCYYDNTIWIVGERGTILKYKDTFTRIYTDEKEFLIHISFNPKENYGLILGHGIILRYGVSSNLSVYASLSVDKKVVGINENIILDGFGSTSNGSVNNIRYYFFDFGDGTTTGWVKDPTFTVSYNEPGVYHVKLKVRDVYGNESEFDTVKIIIEGEKESQIPIFYYFLGFLAILLLIYFVLRKKRLH